MTTVSKKSSIQTPTHGNISSRLSEKLENVSNRSHSAQTSRTNPQELLPLSANRSRSVSPAPIFSPSPRYGSLGNSQVKKCQAYYSRILEQLQNILIKAEEPPEEPESLVDLHRQRKRANEFAVRFSRNQLYQMKRLIGEIKRLIVCFDSLSKNETVNLYKNILLACQTGSQGLQNYINYMSLPQSSDVPEKIKELVLLIKELFSCCEHLSLPVIQNDDEKREFLKILKELISAFDFKIESEEDNVPKKKVNKMEAKENRESKKYSMYKAKLMNANWKKQTEALAKIKFGLPSFFNKRRVKRKDDKKARMTCDIYTQKMHPKCGKYFGNKFVKFDPMKLADGEKTEMENKKGVQKKTRCKTPREVTSQDEDIETIVQNILYDEETRRPASVASHDAESDDSIHLDTSNLKGSLSDALKNLKEPEREEVKESLRKLLKSICHQKKQSEESLASNVKVYHMKYNDEKKEDLKEQNSDEDQHCSPTESVDLLETFKQQKEKDLAMMKERQLNMIFKPIKSKKIKKKEEDGTVPKGKINLTISEDEVSNLLQYKKMFQAYRKQNIMYKKDAARRPWELVSEIADKIIDEVLGEISSGMEDETILERLYYNELLTAV